jgi:hypothetical protein
MVRTASVVSAVVLIGMGAVAASAQAPRQGTQRQRSDLRNQIYVMEGALVRAVRSGAQQVNREMRAFSPELFSLAGDAQARGVYLEGYGVFFDVGVPVMRQSMMWSFRTLLQDERTVRETISGLRKYQSTLREANEKREVDLLISRLELQLGPNASRLGATVAQGLGGSTVIQGNAPAAAAAAPAPAPATAASTPPAESASAIAQDPNRAYTEWVQSALIEAMIDYSTPMRLGENEWLTVAARDNEPRDSLAPFDPYEEVVTIVLRIKSSDLAAYRAGQIDRAEAKRRVQITEF